MKQVALKRIARIVAGQSPPSSEVDDFDGDGLPFLQGNAEFGTLYPSPIYQCDAAPKRCSADDVLLSVRAPVGALNVADQIYGIGRGLCAIRPKAGVNGRFIWWVMNGMGHELDRNSVGSTYTAVTAEDVGALPVPHVGERMQRAIADFLDAETSRIDALIAKKRRIIDLLTERRTRVLEELFADVGLILPVTVDPAALDSVVRPADWRVIRLSQVLRQLTNGYVGPTRDILQAEGVPYIQSLHIKRGRIDFDRRPYYVSSEWHTARPRIALRPNDVLIVQTGDIGQVALVPESIGEASCHALLIARVNRNVISGPYLAVYLQSHLGYHSLLRMATGALHPHLESSIKEVRIIVPPIELQDKLVCDIEQRQELLDKAADRLRQQISLLLEHRQALITAAVTGKLKVPGVAA